MMRLSLLFTAAASLFARQAQGQTLVDAVVGTEDLSYLEAAVLQAGLAVTLSGDGPFT